MVQNLDIRIENIGSNLVYRLHIFLIIFRYVNIISLLNKASNFYFFSTINEYDIFGAITIFQEILIT